MPDAPIKPGPPTVEKELLQIMWRGMNFPISDLDTSFTQSTAQHKFPDRDGVYVESTGRDEIRVSCKALFYNHISRGPLETWDYGTLFPTQFNKFLDACKDRTAGRLVHPFLGGFDAKVTNFSAHITATDRGGATVDVTWVDTIKPDLSEGVTEASNVTSAAKAFDDELNVIRQKKIVKLPTDTPEDFLDQVQKIKSFIDRTTLTIQKALATIDRVLYHINNVIFSLKRANDVLVAPTIDKAHALKASLHDLRANLNDRVAPTRFYITRADMTVGDLVRVLNNTLVELIRLNPELVKRPIVPARTAVKYRKGL